MKNHEIIKTFREQFSRWTYMVEAYGWKLKAYYYDCAEDMPSDATPKCAAYTLPSFKYLEASIHVNVKLCSDMDEKEIEYIVVHELTHLLVSPLQESSEVTPLEYTVTSIARVLQGLRNAQPAGVKK